MPNGKNSKLLPSTFDAKMRIAKVPESERNEKKRQEGEMENFIIIKGLKMRRDAFFDPRGYKYINPLPYPPPPLYPSAFGTS